MITRKQNSIDYPIQFKMVDVADHISGKTGLSPVVIISKNGGAFSSALGTVSEIGYGIYSIAGNADDRSALGELMLHASAVGADDTDLKVMVVAYDPVIDILLQLAAIPVVSISTPVVGSRVNVYSGDTIRFRLSNLGSLVGVKKLYFSAKQSKTDADTKSIVQIEKTSGLKVLNAAAGTANKGSLAVVDIDAGVIDIVLQAPESIKIKAQTCYMDIKAIESNDEATTRMQGQITFYDDITKAVS